MPHSTSHARQRALCDDARLLASHDPDAVVGSIVQQSPTPDDADVVLEVPLDVRRDFVAADGTQWCVHERDASGMLGARGARCLVFETGNVLRVVWHYPRAWRTLDDAALEALSNHE